ncbi:MAG: hypothetical protein AAGI11_04080, partial [Pseudomonadota bacterium]
VNFLSSPPLKYFIVFGISLERVIPIISPTFNQQVEEEFPREDAENEDAHKQRLHRERQNLARQYMRKMINIEVSVPTIDIEKLAELSRQKKYIPPLPETRQDLANKTALFWDRQVFPWLVGALFCAFLFFFPFSGIERVAELMASDTQLQENLPSQSSAEAPVTNQAEAPGPEGDQPAPWLEPTSVSPWFYVGVAFSLLVVFYFWGRASERALIGDSDDFLDALSIWAPIFNALDPTPRHYIRMVNQLRLLNMRIRTDYRDAEDQDAQRDMIVSTLLSAIHVAGIDPAEFIQSFPAPNSGDSQLTPIENIDLSQHSAPRQHTIRAALQRSLQQHGERFPTTWPAIADVEKLDGYMRGLQLS